MNKMKGFSLQSLLWALAIAGILWMFGAPTFANNGIDCKNPDGRLGYTTRAKVANAIGALGAVHLKLERFALSHNRYPENGELDLGLDPWGNPYVFHKFTTTGEARKDHNNVRVNGPFDVYSMGPDGKTATPFTSISGGDDIVIAGDGSYIGIACYHYK